MTDREYALQLLGRLAHEIYDAIVILDRLHDFAARFHADVYERRRVDEEDLAFIRRQAASHFESVVQRFDDAITANARLNANTSASEEAA